MSRQGGSIFVKVIILFGVAVGVSYLLFLEHYIPAAVLALVAGVASYSVISRQRDLYKHLIEFSEAVSVQDFSRRYPVKDPVSVEGKLFTAFNQVNSVYTHVHAEKDIQNQYLNRVINMLDSAIIFYGQDSGKVIWMNEVFKELFNMPHLGSIHAIQKRHAELYEKTIGLKPGQQQLNVLISDKGRVRLLIQTTEFTTKEGVFRMVAYQNITEAMDKMETEAWNKLLRVLTHEIMNSIAPITSLADTLYSKLESLEDQGEIGDVKLGVSTIKNRSEGLLRFARSYRSISEVDQLNYSDILVIQLFGNIHQLLEPTLTQKNIDLDIIVRNTRLVLRADVNLIEQVLINLVLNAIDAVKDVESPYITLTALETAGKVQLKVADNGRGMAAEIQDQIFTPFFTTKKSGSGIGLTLSKRIMLLHNGNILVESEEGRGSVVTMQF